MFRTLILTLTLTLAGLGLTLPEMALAQSHKTITLQVQNMTCGSCPYTVKKALKRVDGVTEVIAEYEGDGKGWARITFDPDKATVEQLIEATTNAGYPSSL